MTLYHLYTIAGLVLALALVYRLFRCPHKWELVDKTEFQSYLETQKAAHGAPYGYRSYEALAEASRKLVVIVISCDRCGAAKILKIRN